MCCFGSSDSRADNTDGDAVERWGPQPGFVENPSCDPQNPYDYPKFIEVNRDAISRGGAIYPGAVPAAQADDQSPQSMR